MLFLWHHLVITGAFVYANRSIILVNFANCLGAGLVFCYIDSYSGWQHTPGEVNNEHATPWPLVSKQTVLAAAAAGRTS
jgi:hypothetical protein